MTTLELILSIVCPVLLVGWAITAFVGYYWHVMAEFYRLYYRGHHRNQRRQPNDLTICIHRASARSARTRTNSLIR